MPAGKVHPTALVDPEARIAPDVEIGPYSVIGPHVRIGAGTRLFGHVVIDGHTQIGRDCQIYPGTCLGMRAQDKKHKECESYLEIGDENIFREHVTIHLGSTPGSKTVLGDRNMLMAGAHVAHDCVVGSDVVMANQAALGGFVTVGDQAVIGGLCGIHQFVRLGRLSMVGAVSKATMDIAPFSVCDGQLAIFRGVNSVGLKRAGFSSERILAIKKALIILLASGLNLTHAADQIRRQFQQNADIEFLMSFCEASKRGVSRAGKFTDQRISNRNFGRDDF